MADPKHATPWKLIEPRVPDQRDKNVFASFDQTILKRMMKISPNNMFSDQ